MDAEAAVDEEQTSEEPTGRRSRRTLVAGVALGGLAMLVLAYGGWRAVDTRPDFAFPEQAAPVAPGGTVVVPAAEVGACGRLFTSLHRRGALGLWSQTHSGNIFDGFHRDERPWWSPTGGRYLTPVPCSIDGETTFTLPDDVGPGTYAACETDGGCVRFRVAG